MTERTEALTQASAPTFVHEGSYIDWSSILAGAVVASGIAFVFTTFGAAVGLGMTSPYDGDGSAVAALLAVGTWMLWTTISSFMAGGYIAGRMRRRVDSASADEVSVRDGIHGLTVWGAAILLGVFMLGATVDMAAQVTAETATSVAAAPENAATESTATEDAATADEPAAETQAAETQVDAATPQAVQMSDAEMKAAAEAARKYSVLSAFVLAASLLIAGAGAYWAAGVGGQHRDEGHVFARFGRWT